LPQTLRWGRLQRSPRIPNWKGAGLLLRGWEGGTEKEGRGLGKEGRESEWKKCSVPPPAFE